MPVFFPFFFLGVCAFFSFFFLGVCVFFSFFFLGVCVFFSFFSLGACVSSCCGSLICLHSISWSMCTIRVFPVSSLIISYEFFRGFAKIVVGPVHFDVNF